MSNSDLKLQLINKSSIRFFNIQKSITMTRLLIIFTLSLFTYISNAQTYVPFPTSADTAVWFVDYYYAPFDYGYYNIVTEGDTIFGSQEYTKLYYNNGTSYTYYAAIREENKVIYLRDLVSNRHGSININSDTILFDFNVQVGDTINWFSLYSGLMEVYSIDSVQVADGTYRKRFNFLDIPGGFVSFQAVEGIGSNLGFIHTPMVGGGGTETYCYFLNGNFVWTLWLGANESDCYTSTKQLKSNSTIKIYPNPTSDNLNIEFETTEQRELMIFNQLGQMVLNESSNQVNVVLSLEDLPKGFYVLAIRSKERTFTKKIVKH